MAFYGRHRIYAIFWTWSIGPFVCMADLKQISGSKSLGSVQRCRIELFPRPVPLVVNGAVQRTNRGYLDVLRPNDWVFLFIDPFDGEAPDPLFMGFIDDVRPQKSTSQNGAKVWTITVACSGWEKAIHTTSCIHDAWVSDSITIANFYDIASRMSEDQYIPLVPGAVAGAVRTFLEAETREEFLQRQANNYLTREEIGRRDLDNILAQMIAAEEDTVVTPAEEHGETPLTAIMGQFELPQTRIPLWRLIKMKFENLRQRTLTTPQGMTNLLGSPLVRFVDEWSNPAINVIIYDVRRISRDGLAHLDSSASRLANRIVGGYEREAFQAVIDAANAVSTATGQLFEDTAPYMILMKRPLFADELLELEGPTLRSQDLEEFDVGFSDSDHYNMSYLEPMLDPSSYRAASGITGFDSNRARAIDMIRRHGLRIYTDQIHSWPDDRAEGDVPRVPEYSEAMFREWNERVQRAGLDQVELLTGSLSIRKYLRDVYLGGRLILDIEPHQGVFASGTRRVFYVEGIDYRYRAENGDFSYSFSVTRGYEGSGSPLPRIL